MHSVIRKRQGLPYTPPESKGFLANSQLFTTQQVRKEPFPPDELGLAFGTFQYPKLVNQATSSDDELRRKALAHILEMLRGAREVSSLVPVGIVAALTKSAEVQHCVESRTLATAALLPLAKDLSGRAAILAQGSATVGALLRLVCDPEPAVRANVLAVCLQLSRFHDGAQALIAGGCVALFVRRCSEEKLADQLAAVLAALTMVTDTEAAGLEQAIKGGAIETVCGLIDGKYQLEQPIPAVCEHGFALLRTLTLGPEQKMLAVSQGVLRILVSMLTPAATYGTDTDPEVLHRVATEAAGALMSITAHTESKEEAVKLGAIAPLSDIVQASHDAEAKQLTSNASSTLTTNALKCISNLAECPLGRKQLRTKALPDLKPLTIASEPLVSKHAELATYRVQWKP